jgi:hypothetical protein
MWNNSFWTSHSLLSAVRHENGDDRAPTKSERSGRYVSRVYGLAAHGLIRLCANKDPDNVRQSGACADRRR